MRAIIQRQASLTQKYLLCAQLVSFLEKLARHILNKAAFYKHRATGWLTSNAYSQLSDASCPGLCLLQSIVQPFAKEHRAQKRLHLLALFIQMSHMTAHCASSLLQLAVDVFWSLVLDWLMVQDSKQREQQHM